MLKKRVRTARALNKRPSLYQLNLYELFTKKFQRLNFSQLHWCLFHIHGVPQNPQTIEITYCHNLNALALN